MRTRAHTLAVVTMAVVLAACGSEDPPAGEATGETADDPAADAGDTPSGEEAGEETGEAAGEAGGDEAAGGEGDVAVASTELGDVLVDADGMTLYLFTNDQDGQSVCEDDCAVAWPPLLVEDTPTAGAGVDPSLLGTTERSDGTTQVTYADWPLYTWASDQAPGDVTGQGVGGVWFVVDPQGEAIEDEVGAAAGDDGY
ncbi:hypothetical protein [Egicoccus sp. AB-alg6-2]|uniref:COG4315 family predicted lipoprotein n=1 Tax=Egicoccus sp. AB-alg6-2 TaxID=3242692 RepID=UPI00359DD0B9